MKNNYFLIAIVMILLTGCSAPQYLPSYEDIDVSPYGAYIRVYFENGVQVSGELISLDTSTITILIIPKYNELVYASKCVIVPISDVSSFTLQYAQPPHYGWSIPFFTVVSFTHGFLGILTIPVNIIVTSSVTAAGEQAYKYYSSQISVSNLKNFARFPQGLPESVDITKIQ